MTHNESHVLRTEACPECRKLGNDRSGDNLAIYSDGHVYCFRCGYHTGRTKIKLNSETPTSESSLVLPSDVTSELPYGALTWLAKYGINRIDRHRHHIMWSPYWSRIIFPYFDETGLIAWQGRYIGDEETSYQGNGKKPAKWYSKGDIHHIIHPINVENRTAVLVEDIVSAIRVSKHMGAIPIFGSTISKQHFIRLKHIVDSIVIWLDPDMKSKSIVLSETAKLLGLSSKVVFSERDPKEHSDEEIDSYLKIR